MSGRTKFWRSPADQLAWARPTLLGLTVIAGFLYAWNGTGNLEVYYAAAVRSMSMSWHNFFFAAFDPAGTITLDKLPGAFWVQALSARLFGVHAWALVAPQVLEGMASVLVLYRVVRRLSGALAAIIAAGGVVLSPATVALSRGNISDTLMVLLLLLAADATVSAVLSGRWRSLIWAGVFTGLAFQAKMIEAWVVAPAFALCYLVATGGRCAVRLARVGAATVVMVAVSLSWMVVVALWPAAHRPWIDGSQSNSIFSQVFVYNGFGRLDQASPNQLLSQSIGLRLPSTHPSWDRLLKGPLGHDTGWLIPAALIALAVLVLTESRRDRLVRAACALWGTWLVVLLVVFSASSTVNAYYMAALSPAIAGLLGMGAATAWDRRESPRARMVLAAVIAVTCAYAVALLPSTGVGLIAGLPEAVVVLGVAAVVALLAWTPRAAAALAALAGLAIAIAPAAASASVVVNSFGPFDTPFEPVATSLVARALGGVAAQTEPLLPPLERAQAGHGYLMATQTSAVAAPFIYDSGQEVLPIGGFTGTMPEPSLASLRSKIASGQFHLVVQAPVVTDPRLAWVAGHCFKLPSRAGSSAAAGGLRFSVYFCGRPGGL